MPDPFERLALIFDDGSMAVYPADQDLEAPRDELKYFRLRERVHLVRLCIEVVETIDGTRESADGK